MDKIFRFTLTSSQVVDLFALFDAARSGVAQLERVGMASAVLGSTGLRDSLIGIHETFRDQFREQSGIKVAPAGFHAGYCAVCGHTIHDGESCEEAAERRDQS